MLCSSDYQRSKVYHWEHMLPNGKHLSFAEIAHYVARIWAASGREHPPLVKPMPKQNRRWAGDATRCTLRFPENGATQRVVLHEIAHALTATVNGASDAHGPLFVSVYMKLLAKHLDIALPMLWYTATKDGVDFDMTRSL